MLLLDAATVADPAAAAGTILGSFLNALAATGTVGASLAAALFALVVISGARLVHVLRNPQAPPVVNVTPSPEAAAAAATAAAVAAPPPPSAAALQELTDRVARTEEGLEEALDWQREHAHWHEVEAVAARAREEGARAERERIDREPTNPGTGRRR